MSKEFRVDVDFNNAVSIIGNFTASVGNSSTKNLTIGTALNVNTGPILTTNGHAVFGTANTSGVMIGYNGNTIQGRTSASLNTNGNLYINPYGGNVGIGATSAGNTLTVNGTASITGATTVDGNFTASTNTSTLSTTTNIGGTSNQRITLFSGAGAHGIEIGRTDSIASTPYIDFHSSSVTNDYDVRLIANGSSSVGGEAQLAVYGSLWMQNKGIGSTAAPNTFASVTISSGNLTVSTGNLTVSAGTTTLGTTNTGTITSTASIIGSIVHANSNGAGTNFRVGDDVWIGDINIADTMSIRGISGASSNGYIRFGSDSNSFGYNGLSLTYSGSLNISGNLTASVGTTTLGTTNTGGITIAAGTTSISPLKLTSGTLNTTPTAGVIEYDGNAFYATTNTSASSRGVIPVNIFATNTANVALSAVNTAQSIFAAADDAVAVAANTAYKFTLFFALSASGTSTTAYSENFLFGGTAASVATFGYRIITQRNSTAITQPGQGANLFWSQSSSANLFAATATTAQYIITSIEGIIRTTSSGTLTPQIQFTATPQNTISASILANAYIELTPIGSSAVAGMTAWT